MRSRGTPVDLLKGTLAALILVAAVVAVPVGLWALAGSPLPERVPSVEQLGRALVDGEVEVRTVVKVLAAVCWLAWAQLVLAVGVEAGAALGGRPARRHRIMAPAQGLVTALVSTFTVALTALGAGEGRGTPRPLAHAGSPGWRLRPLAFEALVAPDAGGPGTGDEAPPTAGHDAPVHVVARRESLWSIAERRLGDPRRWVEILELNRGRTQPDGGKLRSPGDPLRPGWELVLPPDARTSDGEGADAPVGSVSGPSPASTEPAETLAPAGLETVAAQGDLPAAPGSILAALGGAGLFAAGFVWSLTRLREAQERRRPPGTRVLPAPHAARALEAEVRAAADVELAEFVDLALRAFAARLARAGRTAPPIVGVNVADEVSLLFGAPDPEPVEGFTVEDEGFSWMISRATDLDALRRDATGPHPLPALVTLGHTPSSQVLLNLAVGGPITVLGDPPEVEGALFAMAAELASGPAAGGVEVVTVGLTHELSPLPAASSVAGVGDALAVLDLRGPAPRRPVVVLVGPAVAAEAGPLVDRASQSDGSIVAVVADAVLNAHWQLEVTEADVTLLPVGVTLARHRLDEGARAAVVDVLRAATAPPALPARSAHPDHSGHGEGAPSRPPVSARSPAPSVPVELRILGPVEAVGHASPFRRRKALELAVYLATHRRGADGDTLCEALWPGRLVSPATLHTIVSLARQALGHDPEGTPYLPPRGSDGLYRLRPEVGLDYERFSAAVERASTLDAEAAIAELHRALELVRGRPFTVGGGEYLWAHAEALVSAAVADVADAAHRLATLYLERGDARGAWWATQQGLLASPGNEQLHRDRMLAADLAGNPAGVDAVMEELCAAMDVDLSEAEDMLHPMTLEVYERLTRGRPRRAWPLCESYGLAEKPRS